MSGKLSSKVVSRSIYNDIKIQLDERFVKKVDLHDEKEIAGWFMGTRGENLYEVSKIIESVLQSVVGGRETLFPDDPAYITEEIKASEGYKRGFASVERETENLLKILNRYSLPTQSLRYQGHMLWDITLPSMIGYFAAMLQNQNNVTPQASPATTLLELLASNDIARMAGFHTTNLDEKPTAVEEINAWAHISCDGSVANIESLWAARELKFMPLGIKYALNAGEYLESISDSLRLPDGRLLKDATAWELLNLKQDDTLALPEQIAELICAGNGRIEEQLVEVWETLVSKYSLNSRGIMFFSLHFLQKEDIKSPALIVPSTKHYSWPKAASVLGMGNGQKGLSEEELVTIGKIEHDGLINVYVDPEGKVKPDLLERILRVCRDNKKPVVMVVGVMGTTEEGAVDPMEEILAVRERFREDLKSSFDYSVHADAAWGGYFLTCCRNEFPMEDYPEGESKGRGDSQAEQYDNKDSWFREAVFKNMVNICNCDSVTIDPHKMGYIPYPAGSLIYRNDRIINLLSFTAPYINSGSSAGGINIRKIGECGIEGSKSGAAAASVYLSHMVIRPDKRGYGKIINQSMLNSKIFYLYLNFLEDYPKQNNSFEVVMFDRFPEKYSNKTTRAYLKRLLWDDKIELGSLDIDFQEILRDIAGDQNIVDYIFVDRADREMTRTTALNEAVFRQFSIDPEKPVEGDEIFVSMTTFHRDEYGDDFMDSLGGRVYKGVQGDRRIDQIPCIRSVIMDPWAIYTYKNDKERRHNFFKDIFIPELCFVVNYLCGQSTEVLQNWVKKPLSELKAKG